MGLAIRQKVTRPTLCDRGKHSLPWLEKRLGAACPSVRPSTAPHAGIYLFFVFFAVSLLVIHLVFGLVRLWLEGVMPKILLVARAHSMSPQTIVRRVLARK